MANTYTTLSSLFTGIADAIRAKTGGTAAIKADDFPTEIANIPTGGGSVIPSDLPQDGKMRICYRILDGKTGDDLVLTLAYTHATADTQTTIDWGDNSTPEVLTGSGDKSVTHTVPAGGADYIASVKVDSGSITLGGSQSKTIYAAYNKDNAGNMRQYIYWAVIGSGVTSIGSYAFNYCTNLTEVAIPSGVTDIGIGAFKYCTNLTKVTISSGVTSIGNSAFNYCTNLTEVAIPSGVTSIGSSTFDYCTNLTKVTIPSSVTSIGSSTFDYCTNLTEVTIPSSVTSIGGNAFSYCTNLTKVTIPSGVTSIGGSAFNPLYGAKEIHFKSNTPPTAGSSAFGSLPTTCKIYVPTGYLSAYTTASNYPSSSTYTYIEEE